MSDKFEAEAWIERLAVALRGLSEGQRPFLEEYWRYNPRHYVEFDGRDETPFPLNDLGAIYFLAKHGGMYGEHAYYAPLRAAMHPVRTVLRSHPVLWRALGLLLDNDGFWVQIRGHGSRTSLTDLIGGLMRAPMSCLGTDSREPRESCTPFSIPQWVETLARCQAVWTSDMTRCCSMACASSRRSISGAVSRWCRSSRRGPSSMTGC